MTYLWQEEKKKKFYRIQTDEKSIADKLKRRKKYRLSMICVNRNLWIYSCEFNRTDEARKTLRSITGKNGKIDYDGIIIYE